MPKPASRPQPRKVLSLLQPWRAYWPDKEGAENLDNTVDAAVEASRVSRIAEASRIAFQGSRTLLRFSFKNKHLSTATGGWAKFESTDIAEVSRGSQKG